MPAAKPHPEEIARLESLIKLDLLDTAPEQMFDNLIKLAAQVLDVPIALFSLVDENRQWFKSRVGLDVTQTERCDAFCAHAILDESGPLVVEDALTDSRFSDNPLVTGDAHIRFYAGIAVKAPGDALPIGTLCVIDQKPRKISDRELNFLKTLADQLEHLLSLRALLIARNETTLALSHSQALVRGIIDNSQAFVGLMKPDGTLIDVNRTSLVAAGVDADDVLGMPFWETPWWSRSETSKQRLRKAITLAASGKSDSFEATFPISNGRVVDVHFSLSPIIVNGEVAYLVPEGCDITLLKQRERENARYLVSLRETVHDLEQFAYVASHDLRSPLRGISTIANFIKEDDGDNLSESSIEYLGKLKCLIVRMQSLLDDLFYYSRVGRSDEQPEEVKVGDLIAEIIELQAIPEGFEFEVVGSMPTFVSHMTPLRQVILNLVSNAVKHHDKSEGSISISVVEQAEFLEFRISDDGPGIAKRYHKQIFEMFQTLQSRDEIEGSGIGLAVIQKIVRRYDGRVSVESTVGQGTTFIFTWPKKLAIEAAL